MDAQLLQSATATSVKGFRIQKRCRWSTVSVGASTETQPVTQSQPAMIRFQMQNLDQTCDTVNDEFLSGLDFVCAVWDTASRGWSADGCETAVDPDVSNTVVCTCNVGKACLGRDAAACPGYIITLFAKAQIIASVLESCSLFSPSTTHHSHSLDPPLFLIRDLNMSLLAGTRYRCGLADRQPGSSEDGAAGNTFWEACIRANPCQRRQ